MINLSKYQQNVIVELKGMIKDVYKESFENGEGEHVSSFGIEHLSRQFTVNTENFNEEHLINLIVEHLKKNLYNDYLEKGHFTIIDNRIILQVYELNDGLSVNNYIDIKKYEEEGQDVYSCHYDFFIKINGIEVENLNEILPSLEY